MCILLYVRCVLCYSLHVLIANFSSSVLLYNIVVMPTCIRGMIEWDFLDSDWCHLHVHPATLCSQSWPWLPAHISGAPRIYKPAIF